MLAQKYRYNRFNNGRSPISGITSDSLQVYFTLRLPSDFENSTIFSTPAIDSLGNLYVGSSDGNLYSVSYFGSILWKYKTDGNIFSSPGFGADDNLYFASSNYLFSLTSYGSLLWKNNLDDDIYGSPVFSKGLIYVGTLNSLFSFNYSGHLNSKLPFITPGYSTPAIDSKGNIYFTTLNGRLLKVNMIDKNVTIYWDKTIDNNKSNKGSNLILSTVALIDKFSILYFTGSNETHSSAFAYSAIKGNKIWENNKLKTNNSSEIEITSPPSIMSSNGIIFVTSGITLYSLNSTTGSIIFKYSSSNDNFLSNGLFQSSTTVDKDGIVYFNDGVSLGVDMINSNRKFISYKNNNYSLHEDYYNSSFPYFIQSIPVIGYQGFVYICLSDNSIVAVNNASKKDAPSNLIYVIISNILFILPLAIAFCFSVSWICHSKLLYISRRMRGLSTDDFEYINNSFNNTGTRRRQSSNYLDGNWQYIYSLPKIVKEEEGIEEEKENICPICFSEFFVNYCDEGETKENINDINIQIQIHKDNVFSLNSGLQTNSIILENNFSSKTDSTEVTGSTSSKPLILNSKNPYYKQNIQNSEENNNKENNEIGKEMNSAQNSFQQLRVVMLPCSHIFHEDCIKQWSELHSNCPVCRAKPTREDLERNLNKQTNLVFEIEKKL